MPDSPFVGVRMMGPDGQVTWHDTVPIFVRCFYFSFGYDQSRSVR